MTQSIVIQVGQCGNQIGCRFWDLALKEHASVNRKGIYDDALKSFFRNEGGDENRKTIADLKARAILIDMEEGVVNEIMKGKLRNVFDRRQLITDVSGSGNNWAVGHMVYGQQHRESILENVRKEAESCDSLQCFFILHSMGGGTGSGLGTSVLRLVAEEYPDVYRFVTAVYPSFDDDVITSPYNTMLATNQLTNYANCVLPIENQCLTNIIERHAKMNKQSEKKTGKPFDNMNDIVANLLLNLTSSSRFEGSLNVDLNEITMNLVPFPKLHYILSSMAPIYSTKGIGPRRLDEIFTDAFTSLNHLVDCDPLRNLYLASGLLIRGNVQLSDVRRNIEKLQMKCKFVPWNKDGWKIGLCSVAPVDHRYSLLSLSNNTCIAHIHHYTDHGEMSINEFDLANESLKSLIEEYDDLNTRQWIVPERLKIVL
ncbi:DgyrCDS4090 [Dimorphilus gyrociliatus]|uniref:DgyrCDS4090 n=1 Tax=Dimorphilus gyrociliatus TaxID=2664684 RepID=A0A7I8VI09_9ANNE|nr:DgyrCDS4090 [Dimorphilus gyrociliatus]